MRLLLVSPDLRLMGGVAETVKLLLAQLEGRIDVTAAVLGRRINQPQRMRIITGLVDLWCFFILLCRNHFDVIHMNPSMNFLSVIKESILFMLFCLFGYSGRILLFFHGWDEAFFRRIAAGRFSSLVLRKLLGRSGKILVLAGTFKDSLVRAGVDGSRIRVVTTMVDIDALPRSYACEGDGKSLLFLSRMVAEKGVYEILDAFAILQQQYGGVTLIMAGDGPERDKLMKLADQRALHGVSFPGYIQGDEKLRVLGESCIFLIPTRYGEGCPVAMLEAMTCAMVPVVAAAGGITDVILPGENAVLLDEISGESIAEAVSALIGDPGNRMRMAANARNYALEHFSSAEVSGIVLSCYEDMVAA